MTEHDDDLRMPERARDSRDPQPVERTGVLIVRVWTEGQGDGALRARITSMLDAASGEEAVSVAASVEEIRAAVGGWLDTFVESS